MGMSVMAGPVLAQNTGDQRQAADLILINGKITTMDVARPDATAVAVKNGYVMAVGTDGEISKLADRATRTVDLQRRRVIPGLIDSHAHLARGGLTYNMELRWEGVQSVAVALEMLREQARRTPAPQWVRVVGGWSEFQFKERRMPTLEEINAASPDTPVFVLHLYDRALLNRAALRACGYTKDTPQPPGAIIERDQRGEPTGLLLAEPNAFVLYNTLAKGPKLGRDDQLNSMLQFMREENRLGVTSVGDAGGGFQNYPSDYGVLEQLSKDDRMTVRVALNIMPQRPKEELDDIKRWVASGKIGQGNDYLRLNGVGEALVFSAADAEDFLMPRPDLAASMEVELEKVVRFLASSGWPWRMHATYNETVVRALDVFEKVDREIPIGKLGWFFDHCETVSPQSLERIKKLGGAVAVQNRMSVQGDYFVRRYGLAAAAETPPVKRMLAMGIPVALGTDATRVNSYNPWMSLYWLVAGKTVSGAVIYPEEQRLSRVEALRLMTADGAWFSKEAGKKGVLKAGAFADLAVLDSDYLSVPEEDIPDITAVLTVVAGKIVYGSGPYASVSPGLPPASPNWSPVLTYGGLQSKRKSAVGASEDEQRFHYAAMCRCADACLVHAHNHAAVAAAIPAADAKSFWGAVGCTCFL